METHALFAVPVLFSDEYPTTPLEASVIGNQEWRGNVGGNKTSVDNYVLNRPELAGLKAFLQAQIELFGHRILKVKTQCQFYITQSWVNVNEKGTQHHLHAHQNSLISGVFYLDGDNSPIVFQRPATHNLFGNTHLQFEELTLLNSGEIHFPARRNRAMLFPSTTVHRVLPNKTDTPRISLAFNSFARGHLGSAEELSELPL
jgi:uncharacterized protein (TIGR02466 family)